MSAAATLLVVYRNFMLMVHRCQYAHAQLLRQEIPEFCAFSGYSFIDSWTFEVKPYNT
jgi:hypothetical protein